MPSPLVMLSFWQHALGSPTGGIYMKTPDPLRLKSLLYTARAQAKDPSLAHLQLRTSPKDPKGELWIFNPAAMEG